MRKNSLLLVLLIVLTGCLDFFGPDITTTTPSAGDVSRCRAEMYLDSNIEIQPEGFKLTSGIDDAIWFRFVAKTDQIAAVFRKDTVDTSKFAPGFKHDDYAMPSWWDASTKSLVGGRVSLPNAQMLAI
jgi:hypothetical protein